MIKWSEEDEEDDNKQNNDKITKLQSICDLIRFPLMKGEYFAENVVPLKVLTQDEAFSVSMYMLSPKSDCKFNQRQRKTVNKYDNECKNKSWDVYTEKVKQEQRNTIHALLAESKFSDSKCLIGPNQTERKINRVFLATISPVFAVMLYGKMVESKANSDVIIKEIDPDGFRRILNYAYYF